MVLDPVVEIRTQEVKAQAVFLQVDLFQEPLAKARPVFGIENALED